MYSCNFTKDVEDYKSFMDFLNIIMCQRNTNE